LNSAKRRNWLVPSHHQISSATGPAVVIIFVGFRRPWSSAYFLAQPEIPPLVSRVNFSLFPGCRQPNAYLSAWVHRLFARLFSGPADASIKIRIGCDFL
jgi:hypothetical protein